MDETIMFPGVTQTVAIGVASAASTNAIGDNTNVVRIVATSACFIQFAASPVATSAHIYIPAGVPCFFRVNNGPKVAVIRASADGSLYVTEMR